MPSLEQLTDELRKNITSTDVQVINSVRAGLNPRFELPYNIFVGGTKLARGVTIERLLVTYYGRQPKSTKMDTMLQHARMFGYRKGEQDVTRLFITPEVENRFQLIYESEKAMREVIEKIQISPM